MCRIYQMSPKIYARTEFLLRSQIRIRLNTINGSHACLTKQKKKSHAQWRSHVTVYGVNGHCKILKILV